MEIFTCTQHGCEFEAEETPEVCPVCNNPQGDGEDLDDWSSYTKAELIAQCADWDLDGYSSRSSKAELIALLEENEEADGDDG